MSGSIAKIAVIDDEMFMRSTVKQMLKALGAVDAREAADGAAGVVLVEQFRPDVVICDIAMKPVDGLVLVEKVRGHIDAEINRVPIVLLTGRADQASVQVARRFGVTAFLVKPVSRQDLIAKVQFALSQRSATAAAS